MKKKVIALFCTILHCVIASADSVWKVGTDQHFPPYVYKENGVLKGIHYEIVSAVIKKMKITYKVETYPWARLVQIMDSNKLDFSYPWIGKPERFDKYIMVGPLHTGRNILAIKAENDAINYNSLDDLKGLTIGTVRSYSYGEEFDSASFLTFNDQHKNNTMLIKKLAAGRIEIIAGDENVLTAEQKLLGISGIKYLPKAIKKVNRYAAFPRTNKKRAKAFASALEAIKLDGTYDAILEKHK